MTRTEIIPIDQLIGLGDDREAIASAYPDGLIAHKASMMLLLSALANWPLCMIALTLGHPNAINLVKLYIWGISLPLVLLSAVAVLVMVETSQDLSSPAYVRVLKSRPLFTGWIRAWSIIIVCTLAWHGYIFTSIAVLATKTLSLVCLSVVRRAIYLSIVDDINKQQPAKA